MTEHTYVNVPRPLDQRPFTVDTPCPECGQQSIIGLLLVNEQEKHMHTWYACTFWSSLSLRRCGWTGWSVPEPVHVQREADWDVVRSALTKGPGMGRLAAAVEALARLRDRP